MVTLTSLKDCLSDSDLWHVDTSIHTIFSKLRKLDTKKSCGSDGIPPRLLKEGAFVLAAPIAHLLSLSVEEFSVPIQWKSADIVPLPKSSSITTENLRPISLLPIIGKILEKRVLASVKTTSFVPMASINSDSVRKRALCMPLFLYWTSQHHSWTSLQLLVSPSSPSI